MQTRTLVKERAQRNLLLVIDGVKSEEMLLAGLAGISQADFLALEAIGLITPSATATSSRPAGAAPAKGSASAPPPAAAVEAAPLDYPQFTAALTELISRELGLRGFVLTLAVEKAGTIEELRAVAQRALTQIEERKGAAAAAVARRALYGS